MDQFKLLRLYVDIAERGTLSAVARAHAISPSTVTLALRQLEERVGAKLILRTTRHLSFTQEGERFLNDCRRILTDLDNSLESVSVDGEIRGDIRVTATNDFGRQRLAPLINDFMQLHPHVHIDLHLNDAMVDMVSERFDVALRMGPLQSSGLVAKRLLPGRRCVCASPAYWDRYGRPSRPRDLLQHNCLVLARPGSPMSNWNMNKEGQAQLVRVSGDRMANDGGALVNWALSGAGVALLSSIDIQQDLEAGRLETALDEYTTEDVSLYAVHPAGRQPSHRVRAFIDFLEEHLNDLQGNAQE